MPSSADCVLITRQATGKYVLVVNQMLTDDVAMVIAVLIPFLLTFSSAMWPILPTDQLYARDNIYGYISVVWSLLLMIFSGRCDGM